MAEQTITLTSASAHMLESMFAESKRRGEQDTQWMKDAANYIEVLIAFAYKRKHSEWESRDKYSVNKVLGDAFRKAQSGQALTAQESELLEKAKVALGDGTRVSMSREAA